MPSEYQRLPFASGPMASVTTVALMRQVKATPVSFVQKTSGTSSRSGKASRPPAKNSRMAGQPTLSSPATMSRSTPPSAKKGPGASASPLLHALKRAMAVSISRCPAMVPSPCSPLTGRMTGR